MNTNDTNINMEGNQEKNKIVLLIISLVGSILFIVLAVDNFVGCVNLCPEIGAIPDYSYHS